MPLSEKARIEVYIPDQPSETYQNLITAFEQEFTHTFGGCSMIRGMEGSYLSTIGLHVRDRVNLLYTDIPAQFTTNFETVSEYTDEVRNATYEALDEESVLIVCFSVFHSE